jgi:hypothetical protein
MTRRLNKTLVDYLVIAISPALIMALVGSLVFFLIEVFYRGNFQGRLEYIFAMFVIGTVLVGRISIDEGRERAVLFAIPLGIATLLAINRFVEFQGNALQSLSFFINCGMMGLVWWSADKLTWDCTLIDESEDDSGEGLLEAVGLEGPGRASLQNEIGPRPPEPEAVTSRDARPRSWWQRHVERRHRPHAPGIWVVYFSLAAVALFGVGQLFIPADDLSARRRAFILLCVYTASGLCLLQTTSFLGLRRYLRQRRQEMPFRMVNLWVTLGTAIIAGVMLTTMLLPRPNPEYAVSELPFRIGSPDQTNKSSRHGAGRDAVEEKKPWSKGVRRDERSSVAVPAKDRSELATKSSDSDKKQAGRNGSDRSTENKDSRDAKQDSPNKSAADSSRTQRRETEAHDDQTERDQPQSTDSPQWLRDSDGLLSVALLKWIVYLALALIAAFWTWSHRLRLLAALADFWRQLLDLLRGLFGGPGGRTDSAASQNDAAAASQRRFADFTDPFASGLAAAWPPEEVVRYTFEAMEAWAREHGCPREPEQTPHEFARCLASKVSSMADDTGRLAELYCQAAYASGTLQRTAVTCLSRLWATMASCGPESHAV